MQNNVPVILPVSSYNDVYACANLICGVYAYASKQMQAMYETFNDAFFFVYQFFGKMNMEIEYRMNKAEHAKPI